MAGGTGSTGPEQDGDEVSRLLRDIDGHLAEIRLLEAGPPVPRCAWAQAVLLVAFTGAVVRTCLRLAHGRRPTRFTSDDYLLLLLFTAAAGRAPARK